MTTIDAQSRVTGALGAAGMAGAGIVLLPTVASAGVRGVMSRSWAAVRIGAQSGYALGKPMGIGAAAGVGVGMLLAGDRDSFAPEAAGGIGGAIGGMKALSYKVRHGGAIGAVAGGVIGFAGSGLASQVIAGPPPEPMYH